MATISQDKYYTWRSKQPFYQNTPIRTTRNQRPIVVGTTRLHLDEPEESSTASTRILLRTFCPIRSVKLSPLCIAQTSCQSTICDEKRSQDLSIDGKGRLTTSKKYFGHVTDLQVASSITLWLGSPSMYILLTAGDLSLWPKRTLISRLDVAMPHHRHW